MPQSRLLSLFHSAHAGRRRKKAPFRSIEAVETRILLSAADGSAEAPEDPPGTSTDGPDFNIVHVGDDIWLIDLDNVPLGTEGDVEIDFDGDGVIDATGTLIDPTGDGSIRTHVDTADIDVIDPTLGSVVISDSVTGEILVQDDLALDEPVSPDLDVDLIGGVFTGSIQPGGRLGRPIITGIEAEILDAGSGIWIPVDVVRPTDHDFDVTLPTEHSDGDVTIRIIRTTESGELAVDVFDSDDSGGYPVLIDRVRTNEPAEPVVAANSGDDDDLFEESAT